MTVIVIALSVLGVSALAAFLIGLFLGSTDERYQELLQDQYRAEREQELRDMQTAWREKQRGQR